MARARAAERGAALLVVMVAVTVLTALAVDLAYDTQVSLRIAGNARDELRATYLAKSGVALSRLVVSFQQDVDAALPSLPNVPSLPRPQLWRLVPVGSDLAGRLFGGPGAGAALAEGAPVPPAGGFEADVQDEGSKVNVQLEALGTNPLLAAQVRALYQLVCDSRWDALFDREDENGVRVSRQDLLVYLRDWVDDDAQSSALAASFPGGSCVMITPQNPFEPGFQDENYPYDRGEDRYRAKNARMDSLAELSMVAGVTDAFLAAFGDAITVYLPRDAKRSVNVTDAARLLDLARIMADPPSQPALYDPAFAERLQKLVHERTLGGILSLSPWDLGQLVKLAGVSVDENLLTATGGGPFEDRSLSFRIRALGRAGDVEKTVDAVVRFDKPQSGVPGAQPGVAGAVAGVPVSVPGKLVHWREE